MRNTVGELKFLYDETVTLFETPHHITMLLITYFAKLTAKIAKSRKSRKPRGRDRELKIRKKSRVANSKIPKILGIRIEI